MHAVPLPMTGNYMPPKSGFGIDESKFTYRPKHSTTSESDAKTSNLDSCKSSSSEETLETVPKPIESKPKVVNKPKVWSDAPIIEEYESDDDDEHVTIPSKEQEKPSFAFVNIVKHVKTPRQTILDQDTCSQNPKVNQRDWSILMSKRMGLGYGYTKKACFGKSTGPREHRPVWNNVQRLNHQNKFVPTVVLTKTGRFPVHAARQNFTSQVATTRTARKVNTVRPKVNEIRPRHNVYKSHSPIRRPFNKTTAPKAKFAQHKVNTAGDKSVSAVWGKWETVVKASTDTECLVLSPDLKLRDENQVLLRVSKQHNMYSFNLKNIFSSRGLACLIAKATVDESTKWHRRDIIEFCGSKGIKKEYSNDKTPQQNGVDERKNRTLIEAVRTMLADSFLPNTFWAEAVSTACYVLNKVLVTK
nr:hypothetical protein [Tanacetum cinerariifolium]